jgi:predicted transcriptional regulator
MVSEIQVLNALANDKSLALFDTIALEAGDSQNIMKRSRLNRKGYYSRISALIKSGLVEKRNGTYYLTSFGEVALEARKLLASGIKDYWKLKAINSIGLELPPQERNQIIAALIENQEIKELLLRKAHDIVTNQKQNQKQNQRQKNTHAT